MSKTDDELAVAGCAWIIVCTLLTIAWLGALIWLVIAVIHWLGRH